MLFDKVEINEKLVKLLGFHFYQKKCYAKGREVSRQDAQLFKPQP